MGDSEKKSKKPAAKKTSWFKGLKGQFKTISWPTPETVGKQTGAVFHKKSLFVSFSFITCAYYRIVIL